MERKGLGRGLSALLADVNPVGDSETSRGGEGSSPTMTLPIERLHPNPNQPRRSFPEAELDDLAASVREKGVIQPLIVRPHPEKPDQYEIVAGERRWRAAQKAQLHELPVLVRSLTDTEVLELAIVENIQRSDLNPLDEALGYRQLMDRFGHTQERLGEALGKSRSHIANLLRLLTLPEPVLSYLREGRLTAGHARALVTANDPTALARQVVQKSLSVRETEALVRRGASPTATPAPARKISRDADTVALEQDLTAKLGLPVLIRHLPGAQRGEIRICYGSLDELDGLCQLLSR
jgi:ParB family transcriptional regulator, chromosome partitioning protein